MRDHNEVNIPFLVLAYVILGGVVIYIVYTFFTRSRTKLEENEDKKLKFVEVFIKESSKNYNKMFQDYNILR